MKAHDFHATNEHDRRQRRFDFTVHKHPMVRNALQELFHGKCAYCETKAGVWGGLEIEHFRPKGGVVRPDGTLLPDHYWWLALEWDNLYLACIQCNRRHRSSTTVAGAARPEIVGKGDRFPLEDESTRAVVLADWEQLANEKPLLLDPCRDDPTEHLVFLTDGLVSCA